MNLTIVGGLYFALSFITGGEVPRRDSALEHDALVLRSVGVISCVVGVTLMGLVRRRFPKVLDAVEET